MARRKDHSRGELYELAVEAGRKLVAAQGPEGLSARKVAARIGYTPGTLYNVFANIDDLAGAINIRTLDGLSARIDQILARELDARATLQRISRAYLDLFEQQPGLWSLLFAHPVPAASDAYHQAIHAVFDRVVDVMLTISGNRTAARKDAKLLWSTLHGICLLQRDGKLDVTTRDSPETLIRRFLENCFTSTPNR